jgi:hypothetical protein
MGEMDNNVLQLFYNGKPIRQGDLDCGHITKPSPTHAERMASLKSEVDALAKEYKPIIDKLMEEIYESSQKPIKLLSEETAQRIDKVFKDFNKTVSSVFPSPFTKSTKRKHYKPNFTL